MPLTDRACNGMTGHPVGAGLVVNVRRTIPAIFVIIFGMGCQAIDRDPILGSSPQTPILRRNGERSRATPDAKAETTRDDFDSK